MFFKKNGFYASNEDIFAIVRRLDLNYDRIISKEELVKFFITAARNIGHT